MNPLSKLWLKELFWLVVLFTLAVLIDFLILRQFSLLADTIDIQMHDTYFVIGGIVWTWHIFLLIATCVYLVKEARRGFNRVLPNVILSVLFVALLFLILWWHRQLYSLQTLGGGWVTYPPLDALPKQVEPVFLSSTGWWNLALSGIELLLITGIFLLGYKTGRLPGKTERQHGNQL